MRIALIDQYGQLVGDTVVKVVGPIPAVGVVAYAGLPVLAGQLLGGKKGRRTGLLVALGLLAYSFVREPDPLQPPMPGE